MFERELNRYWKTVVDTIRDGLMVVDTQGRIVSANRALIEMTGHSRSEIVGKPCTVLHCDMCNATRNCNGETWCELFRTGSFERRQGTLTTKDGRRLHIIKNASLLIGDDENIMGAVETLTDITAVVEKDIQLQAVRRELHSREGFQNIIGTSRDMQFVLELAKNAALSDAPVLILGESGTGKDLVARAIHNLSERRRKPFIKVSCAALTESLLESELFGHVKGAYTGAYRNRTGRFEAAAEGDVFLDEIGDLPMSTQVKLLRVLEENVIERVGDNTPIAINARVISATNKNLKERVDAGLFRDDLFYRINVIPITLPPLRHRLEDVPLLAEYFFRKMQWKTGKKIQGLSESVMRIFMEYPWPGNVRELKSCFEYAFVSCQETIIHPRHLPPRLRQEGKAQKLIPIPSSFDRNEKKRVDLIDALKRSGGNRSEAARMLGISRVTVWNRMKRYGIDARIG